MTSGFELHFDANNAVTTADVPGFVAALLVGGACPPFIPCCAGDLNSDGLVDGNGVSGFIVKLLTGGACL